VSRLADAGIPVTELSLRLPSLDEVFYALTGHGTASIPTREGAVA
jgi:oleandomycin transport system ATP-binding protein